LITRVFQDGSTIKTPFVDMVVYHHKTCFRMYKCTKTEYYRPLEIDSSFELPTFIQAAQDDQARDRLIFRYTIPSAVPPGTPIISIDNEDLISSILPQKAFQYDVKKPDKKQSFILFKNSTSVPPEEATHIEIRSDETLYRKVSEIAKYYDQLAQEKWKYFTYEIFTEETILVLGLKSTHEIPENHLLGRNLLEDLEKFIYQFFGIKNDKDGKGYILQVSDSSYHLYWPNIIIKLNQTEEIVNQIKKRWREQTEVREACLVNCYLDKKVPLLGTYFMTDSERFRVKFRGCFGKDGILENENEDKRTLLQLLSVRK